MIWSRFAVDRIDDDGSQAPVQCWLAQGPNGLRSVAQVCPVTLVPADYHDAAPVPARIKRLIRKRQLAGSLCAWRPPDRAPFTFYANRCPRLGNGAIDVLDFEYDPDAPLHLWLRWRLSARAQVWHPALRLYCQQPRCVDLSAHAVRYYPAEERWLALAAPVAVRHERLCGQDGHHVHLWCTVPVHVQPAGGGPAQPGDGFPPYRSALRDLPMEAIVERYGEARGGRSRSVLTFDKRSKPW